jgi:hypothetical protein
VRQELQTLLNRLTRLQSKLKVRPRIVRLLPKVFLTEDGQDLAGCEEANANANRRAELAGFPPKEYLSIPEDGGEP